jgi:membrane-associated phospholipid phosphatase
MQPSAVRRILERLRTRYREGIAELQPNAFRTWKTTIAIAFMLELLLIAGLVATGKQLQANGALAWEKPFLLGLREHGPFTFSTAVFYQTFGTDITLAILIILTAGIAVWVRRPISAWSIVLAYIAVDPVVRLGWFLWDRTRPDLLYQGVAAPAFHSFPSGHTAKTLAVYGILTVMWIRASNNVAERAIALVLLAVVAVIVPLGRLSMGVHWPTDIIGGWILGLFWLAVLSRGLRAERR